MAFRFPRSLVPLPDEGLPGYLLRLAHRLDLAPARILQLTGRAGGDARFPCRTSHELMIRLDPAAREAFCRATRLDAAEAGSLCLDSLAPRYPAGAPAVPSRSLILRADWWIFSTASRYCPDCLAGDTPAAKAHGGAWRRSWRLPAVFACTRHRRLLEHLCPQCQRPAFETAAGNGRIPLIPGLKAGGLHPAQCRASDASGTSGVTRGIITACGARLDRAPPPGNLPGTVLDLQQRLCTLLGPHGPETVISAASPAEPARYFTDLRLLTILIGRSWPRARHLLPIPHLADAIGRHVALHDGRQQPSAPQRSRLAGISALARPLDPAAGAGLILIADQILRLPSLPDVREAIQPLLPPDWNAASSLTRKMHLIGSARPDCSPGLLKAVTPLARAYPRRGLKGSRAPEITSRLTPENIPAQLPAEYFDQYLRHIEGASPRLIRRTASVRLVQMITGGPLGDAADFLGLPASRASAGGIRIYAHRGILKITKRAGSQRDPGEFDAALEKIAAHITAAGHLTDYKHRRDTLRTWALGPQDWLKILRSTGADPENQLSLGERDRDGGAPSGRGLAAPSRRGTRAGHQRRPDPTVGPPQKRPEAAPVRLVPGMGRHRGPGHGPALVRAPRRPRPPPDRDYARAILSARPDGNLADLDEQVAARLARQPILDRTGAPQLWCILDEGVLHRPIGGPKIMRSQLYRLAEVAEHPRTTVLRPDQESGRGTMDVTSIAWRTSSIDAPLMPFGSRPRTGMITSTVEGL